MVKFIASVSDLKTFFEKCACKGIVTITPTEKTTRMFFSHFYVDIKDGRLIVKAIDSGEKKMFIQHFLNGIEIEEEGRLGITDVDLILNILSAIPSKRKVEFTYDDETRHLNIQTVDKGTYYGYRVRQENLSEQDEIGLTNSTINVETWDKIHSWEDGVPKITTEGGSAIYDTVVKFKKKELDKVISDSIKLTLDQNLKLSMKEKEITFNSGRESDGVKSKTVIKKEIINPIEFEDKTITNLHPIVNHLFTMFILYCRMAGDKSLKFWIKSEEGNIELNYCSSSV